MSEEYRHVECGEWIRDAGSAGTAPVFDSTFTVAYLGAIPSSHDIIRITRDLVKYRESNQPAGATAMESRQGAGTSVDAIIGWLRTEVEKSYKSAA